MQLKWNGKDDNNPDEVRQMVIEVASYLEVDRAGSALYDELDGRRHGRKGAKTERRQQRIPNLALVEKTAKLGTERSHAESKVSAGLAGKLGSGLRIVPLRPRRAAMDSRQGRCPQRWSKTHTWACNAIASHWSKGV